MRPSVKPNRPFFSSGPSVKRPGWNPSVLRDAVLGRSHRSQPAKAKINALVAGLKSLLEIPEDYTIAITPGSDTCAFEMGLWSLLGPKPVDVLTFDLFGSIWEGDIQNQLKLPNVRVFKGSYDALPNLKAVSPDHDIVFCWNGTTSGLAIPDGDWIAQNRTGLTFCDAISAVFAYDLPWDKLDVTSFSLQKGLGSEAQHGVIVLSPAAMDRLGSYKPAWPMPRLFRMTTAKGEINHNFFKGDTINTPSLLVIEDALDAVNWCHENARLPQLIARSKTNLAAIDTWVNQHKSWIDFRVPDKASRSRTSICLHLTYPQLNSEQKLQIISQMAASLESENVAYDIKGHALDAPCIRIWGGPMVETADIKVLLPWLEWAYKETNSHN